MKKLHQDFASSERSQMTLALGAILTVGVAIRFFGSSTQLWLDEIHSWNQVRSLGSPLEIFNSNVSDNNHILNSLSLMILPEEVVGSQSWMLVRWFSLFCSLLSLICIWKLTFEKVAGYALTLAFLLTFSFPLILLSTEARGYSSMILSILLILVVSKKAFGGNVAHGFICAFVLCLGLLSHYSFLQFLAAFALSFVMVGLRTLKPMRFFRQLMVMFAPVSILLYFLYEWHLRYLTPGTGTLRPYLEVLAETVSVAWGGPELLVGNPLLSLGVFALACTLLLLAAVEIFFMRNERNHLWILWLLCIFIVPAFMLYVFEPRVIYPRYFLASIIGFYVVMASFLSRLWHRDAGGRLLATLLLGIFILGSSVSLYRFLTFGRGEYLGALGLMSAENSSGEVAYLADQQYRNTTVVDFYSTFYPETVFRFIATPKESKDTKPPLWYLDHELRVSAPVSALVEIGGVRYELFETYPHGGLSGFTWNLYRRAAS